MNRRVHLLATPNVQVTAAYYMDVFNGFTRRFAELLHDLGFTVFLYGSEEADVPCEQLVTCINKKEQAELLGDVPYWQAWYDASNPLWVKFNARANAGIQARKQPGDIIATIAGSANLPIWQQHADCLFLEYSIGYRGVCAPYRIFQSQAWRNVLHGACGMEYGRPLDDVVYHWYHEDEFLPAEPEDYVLYVGRLTSVKGLRTVCQTAEAAGVRLLLIGDGDPSLITYGEYLGHMPPIERNRYMAKARALLCPTEYLEPSACVVTEAQLCGTPVIASPWGGFPEYLADGETGLLCKSPAAFVAAVDQSRHLNRRAIRRRAAEKFGWHAGLTAYGQYFDRLGDPTAGAITPQTAAVSAVGV